MEQTATTGTLHQAVLYLPVLSTLFSIFFCYTLFSRYRNKGGGLHLLWWGIGMATYGIGTFTEAYTSIFGWNETIFRSWYIVGAFLGGYPLASECKHKLGIGYRLVAVGLFEQLSQL